MIDKATEAERARPRQRKKKKKNPDFRNLESINQKSKVKEKENKFHT